MTNRSSRVQTIAHRGFSGLYPENTLLAFQKALETGCEGIEFDVHLTKDNVPVILHDETVDRTTDGRGLVSNYTYEELRTLNAPANFGDTHGFTPIPSLQEYFELIRGRDILTNIELKNGTIWYEGMEQIVLDMADAFGRRDSVLLSSFNHCSILECQRLDPGLQLAFLEESRLIDPARYCADHNIRIYHPMAASMTTDVLSTLRAANIRVNVWTVNAEADMRELAERGVDGIITNFPDLCASICRERS